MNKVDACDGITIYHYYFAFIVTQCDYNDPMISFFRSVPGHIVGGRVIGFSHTMVTGMTVLFDRATSGGMTKMIRIRNKVDEMSVTKIN